MMNTILTRTSTPTLSPQTPHLLNHGRRYHLANALKHIVNERTAIVGMYAVTVPENAVRSALSQQQLFFLFYRLHSTHCQVIKGCIGLFRYVVLQLYGRYGVSDRLRAAVNACRNFNVHRPSGKTHPWRKINRLCSLKPAIYLNSETSSKLRLIHIYNPQNNMRHVWRLCTQSRPNSIH